MKINYLLEITQHEEARNYFTGKGEKALAEMVKALTYHTNKKNNDNILKTKVSADSVKNYVEIKVYFKNGYLYEYTFSGEDLHKVYIF
jgi:predicted transcriptional regulator